MGQISGTAHSEVSGKTVASAASSVKGAVGSVEVGRRGRQAGKDVQDVVARFGGGFRGVRGRAEEVKVGSGSAGSPGKFYRFDKRFSHRLIKCFCPCFIGFEGGGAGAAGEPSHSPPLFAATFLIDCVFDLQNTGDHAKDKHVASAAEGARMRLGEGRDEGEGVRMGTRNKSAEGDVRLAEHFSVDDKLASNSLW